jgi:hypothetical protein
MSELLLVNPASALRGLMLVLYEQLAQCGQGLAADLAFHVTRISRKVLRSKLR